MYSLAYFSNKYVMYCIFNFQQTPT